MILGRRHLVAGLAALPLATRPLAAETACPAGLPADFPATPPANPAAEDWPGLGHYAEANRRIAASGTPVRVVFIGDSITQGWPDKRPEFFVPGRVCRGIGGQTTPQMVLRMMADVIALKPRQVHIMGGTNDIAGNTGPITAEQTLANIAVMIVLARAHGIAVLLGSIPPAASFPWRPGLETRRTIASLNTSLRALAHDHRARFVDYTPTLADAQGGMKPGYAYDGVHPDTAGYRAMEKVLAPLLR
ncbi:MAG: GDSL-type esterase/lipase family protein [Novosphingobium sp.]|nr:GDSL-type esterase/lipase family protein [Novosphingobium sp.]